MQREKVLSCIAAKVIYAFVPEMIRYYLGQDPILDQVPTYLPWREDDMRYVLDHLPELVVKAAGVEDAVEFFWGDTLVKPLDTVILQLEMDGLEQELKLQVVPQRLVVADILLSREDAAKFGYSMQKGYTDHDGLDFDAQQIQFGTIEVCDPRLYRALSLIPTARNVFDLKPPANFKPVEFSYTSDLPGELHSYWRPNNPEAQAYLDKREKELEEVGIMVPGDSTFSSPWFAVPKRILENSEKLLI